jgi:hypothetical protein
MSFSNRSFKLSLSPTSPTSEPITLASCTALQNFAKYVESRCMAASLYIRDIAHIPDIAYTVFFAFVVPSSGDPQIKLIHHYERWYERSGLIYLFILFI